MGHQHLMSILNDLIEVCKDGDYGFESCAKHAASSEIRDLFARRAEDCRLSAEELQNLVRQNGGNAEDSGTALGAVHRGWVAVLGVIAGHSDQRMLEEAERGEDAALARYRMALDHEDLVGLPRTVIERQLAGVQRNHLQIKTLRDRARARAEA